MVENKKLNKENRDERSTLHALFQDSAQRHPHKTAVNFDDGETVVMVTYSDIQKRADEITTYLEQLHLQGEIVGLYYHAAALLPAFILGILQASAAFAPIDPTAPTEINKYFIGKLNIRTVLVQEEVIQRFLDTLGSELSVRVVQFLSDHGLVVVEIQSQQPLEVKVKSSIPCLDIAYAVHTSGTTGVPKVVKVPHTCIVPNVLHIRDIFDITYFDNVFMAAPLTFDASIVEMFITLSQGATLVIVPNIIKLMPRVLARVLKKNCVTVMQATPTLIRRFGQDLLRSQILSAKSSLRILAFGGEPCPTPNIIQNWQGRENKTLFYDLYGITEVSSWATCYHLSQDEILSESTESVPLGHPLIGTEVDVRDEDGNSVSDTGDEGQLFVGGERFCLIEDEAASMDTMKPTGDWVKITERGLMYIGRRDNQIKRFGKRINLSQIHKLCEAVPIVESCAPILDNSGKLILCAVVVSELKFQSKQQQENVLRTQLEGVLPSHGIPDDVMVVQRLPITAHGKVDNDKLVEMFENRSMDEDIPCYNKEHLQQLWQNSMGVKYPVEEYGNFIRTGGNSINAIHLTESIESWVKLSMPELMDVILHKTFHDVCLLVETTLINSSNSCPSHKLKKKSTRRRPVDEKFAMNRRNDSQYTKSLKRVKVEGCDKDRESDKIKLRSKDSEMVYGNDDADITSSSACFSISRGSRLVTHGGSLHDNITSDNSDEIKPAPVAAERSVQLKEKWSCDTGKCVDASPLLVVERNGGVVYIGSHSHKFVAISLDTGKALWETELGDRVESSACLSKCGQYVVVGCYDGLVYVLHSQSGDIVWRYQTDGPVKCSPVLDAQTSWIIVGSHDYYLHAIDIPSKRCVWSLFGGGGSIFSSPVIGDNPRVLYAATLAGRLFAVDPDSGQQMWQIFLPKPIFSSLTITDNGVMFGCVDGNVYHVDHHGNKVWTCTTAGPVFSTSSLLPLDQSCESSPANDYAVFGSHDKFVYCVSVKSGCIRWKYQTPSEVYSTPFIFKNQTLKYLYDLHRNAEIGNSQEDLMKNCNIPQDDVDSDYFTVVCCTTGSVLVLHLFTGKLISQHSLQGEIFSSPVAYSNLIIVGCRNDNVYCFEM